MKKIFPFFLLFLSLAITVNAQQKQVDSLKKLINTLPADTNKIAALINLGRIYYVFQPDSSLRVVNEAYVLAVKNNNLNYQERCYGLIGNDYVSLGDYGKAMQFYFKAIALCEATKNEYGIIQIHNNIGSTYIQRKEYKKALQYLRMGAVELNQHLASDKKLTDNFKIINIYLLENIGEAFLYLHQTDSAVYYLNKGIGYQKTTGFKTLEGAFLNDLGEVEMAKGNRDAALKYYNQASAIYRERDDVSSLDYNLLSIAKLYDHYGQPDSAIYYAQKSLKSARQGNFLQDVLDASKLLSSLYDKQHDVPEAYKYYKIATGVNDSLYNQDKTRELANIDFDEKQRKEDIAAAQVQYQDTVRNYAFIAGLVILLLIAFIFWRNGRQRQKANRQLQKQKEDIETTLAQLQLTQTQLVQSEKMASLGELTAGIAHEIQNPLNFVNNFSEVNQEMIDELEEALKAGNVTEALAIAADVKQNAEKINHHGRRADFIVKGMLQHSRTSTGERQPTNINTLADEFFKLSYHGLRAKDKTFNADLVTHFDEHLPKVNIVSQDIGRVLLNLFNNGFYAVNQKRKTAGPDYKPTVEVSTEVYKSASGGNSVLIKVKDNGNGIPDTIKEKIMQPFFTTKPTGEGTGLGLSLSYDIVVKGHGGSIEVNTREGEYTEFIVSLPL